MKRPAVPQPVEVGEHRGGIDLPGDAVERVGAIAREDLLEAERRQRILPRRWPSGVDSPHKLGLVAFDLLVRKPPHRERETHI